MRVRAGQRMAHAYLPGRSTPRRHAQVAATVDRAAPVALEPLAEKVGGPSLDRASQVELQAWRPADHAHGVIDLYVVPAGGRIGSSRATARRVPERSRQRRGRDVRAGLAVAAATQRPQERGVDEAAAHRRRTHRSRDRTAQQRPGGNRRPRIRVQPRQVAARVEARQPAVDLGEHRPHVDPAVGIAHDPRDGAHCRKAVVEHVSSTPALSAVLRAARSRRRGCRGHVSAVLLLEVGDLPGAGLCGHRRRGRGWVPSRGRAPGRSTAADQLGRTARCGGRHQLPTCLREPLARRHCASLRHA